MKNIKFFILTFLVIASFSCGKKWDYSNQQDWPKKYHDCGGNQQSPIDIDTAYTDYSLKPLFIEYFPQDSVKIKNTGKTIKLTNLKGDVTVPDTSYFGHQFYLVNIHFHTPSEHTVKKQHFPGEIHFVHIDTSGNIMVIAVFIAKGKANPAIEKILNNIPPKGHSTLLLNDFDPNQLLPNSISYWHYKGSLTTPPCTENVQWFVMKTPITASAEQLKKLESILKNNNRKTQPLNGRKITQF